MGAMSLKKIAITSLKQIETAGGNVLHAMKECDDGFAGFGEAYFSWISPGAIKAWKRHTRMTMNLVVPVGHVKFVFRDVDLDSLNEEFFVKEIGANCYSRITVPPGIWFGFQGLHISPSLVLNIGNIPHDPCEVERLTLDDINYEWSNL